jgi:hypothetical protein
VDVALALTNKNNMSITNITPKQLRRAASLKEKINKLQDELAKLLGGSATGGQPGRQKRNLSAAARKKIADAQRKRWAKYNAAKGK